jgi:hypothetical protein
VNSSWKISKSKRVQESHSKEFPEEGVTMDTSGQGKDKNFTFVQSEIDAEMAKNILYSDTGFSGTQNGLALQDPCPREGK